AINNGTNSAALDNDQRGPGFPRVRNGAADIGALEIFIPPPQVQSVVINGGAAQRSRVTSVQVNFDQVVNFPGGVTPAFQLTRQGDNAVVDLTTMVTNDTATHVTLTFAGAVNEFGSLQDGRYTLLISSGMVTSPGGLL